MFPRRIQSTFFSSFIGYFYNNSLNWGNILYKFGTHPYLAIVRYMRNVTMYLYYISDLSFATVEFCGKSTFINRNSKEEEEEEETNTYPHLAVTE